MAVFALPHVLRRCFSCISSFEQPRIRVIAFCFHFDFRLVSLQGVGEGTPDYQIGSDLEPCLWSFGRLRRP